MIIFRTYRNLVGFSVSVIDQLDINNIDNEVDATITVC
jgi:hypothetical protein